MAAACATLSFGFAILDLADLHYIRIGVVMALLECGRLPDRLSEANLNQSHLNRTRHTGFVALQRRIVRPRRPWPGWRYNPALPDDPGDQPSPRMALLPPAAPECVGPIHPLNFPFTRDSSRRPAMATMPSISQPAQASKVFRLALQAFAALLISILVGIAAAPAQAQVRPIPADAKLAKLKLGVFPDAELNGKSIKLGPGTRIYNRDNIIVIPSTVKDLTMTVAYVTGSLGEVVAVWILTNDEIRQVRARQKRSG